MKPLRLIIALTLVFVMAGLATAKKKVKGVAGIQGVVKAVDMDAKTFDMRAGKKKDAANITVKFDKKTKFLKMTDAGTDKCERTELAPGKQVAVVYDSTDQAYANQVTLIDVTETKK